MIEYFEFYRNQLLLGTAVGSIVAAFGVFVLLQRMVFFGLTLAQAATCAVAVSLMKGWHSEFVILGLGLAFMTPFFALRQSRPPNMDAILLIGMMFFTAVSQLLLAFGGNVQNHLLTAFFGNILTVDRDEWVHFLPWGISLTLLFVLLYRNFTAVFFDRDQAKLDGYHVYTTESIFFVLLSISLGLAINLLGSFYAVSHLILPALFGITITRSLPAAILLSVIYSAAGTALGFSLSLLPLNLSGETIHLPTSSTIILVLCAGLLAIPVIRLAFRKE